MDFQHQIWKYGHGELKFILIWYFNELLNLNNSFYRKSPKHSRVSLNPTHKTVLVGSSSTGTRRSNRTSEHTTRSNRTLTHSHCSQTQQTRHILICLQSYAQAQSLQGTNSRCFYMVGPFGRPRNQLLGHDRNQVDQTWSGLRLIEGRTAEAGSSA